MRYDKYDGVGDGFRAPLAADWAAADGVPIGVGLDVNGRVVPGAGNSGVVGVVILVKNNKKAGDIADVMTDGEIVEVTGIAAGTKVYANDTTGAVSVTGGAGTTKVGYTAEAARLIVRMSRT